MMYRDIYNWVERNKKVDSGKMFQIKQYAFKNKCDEIQALLENKVCNKEEMIKAIKDTYNLETYTGDLNDIKAASEISITKMVDEEFILAEYPKKLGEKLLLIKKPQLKLATVNKMQDAGVKEKITVMLIFNDDFETWKKNNTTDINDNKINTVISNIVQEDTEVEDDVYDANEEELNEASIVGIVNKLILDAVNANASDIHIEPCENCIRIRFRVDGILRLHSTIANRAMIPRIVNRIKVLAKMDTNNFKTPQSGKINMSILEKTVDMRVSTLPSIYGEKVTIRILVSQNVKIRTMSELGLQDPMIEKIRQLAARPYGIILISGPTGSGKSSSLASILSEINKPESCVVTVEDPVEYKIDGVTQVNVSGQTGLTFASVLREILRQDPDVIMVGEIRDVETAKTAITASNTGHLVFSTIHTNGAVAVINRLVDMGIERYMIADSLIGVMSQRLVKRLCPKCKKLDSVGFEEIRKYGLPAEYMGQETYVPGKCLDCDDGYSGRIIIPELLEVTSDVRKAIHDGASSQEIEQLACKQGMVKQMDYAYDLVQKGITSYEEVYRVFGGGI